MTTSNKTGVATKPAKKKNVAKHVLAAAARQSTKTTANVDEATGIDVIDVEGVTGVMGKTNKAKKTKTTPAKKATGNKNVKAPTDVSNYLVLWKLHQEAGSEGSGWKFNKNTQSWLLRHMYNDGLVNKKTFANLVEYVKSMQGKCRGEKRIEAVTLISDYKEWEGKQGEAGGGKTGGGGEEEGNGVQFGGSNFEDLDGHSKRKVYKRARQIYDVLKE
jgi:hypothetical protein